MTVGLGRKGWTLLAYALGLAMLVVVGILAYASLYAGKTISDLLGENRALRSAIANLTEEDQIGYAKVLSQEEREGRTWTRLLFVVTDRDDPSRRLIEREYEIQGDIVFFDALIVKFGQQVVMDGKSRALFLWRRIYGESTPPEDGFPIEIPGQEPKRYGDICAKLPLRDREMFWSEIWSLSDDPERLASAGVRAIYGNAVYKRLRPGVIYVFHIDSSGTFYPQTVPDL
jgi:hypothetical protein